MGMDVTTTSDYLIMPAQDYFGFGQRPYQSYFNNADPYASVYAGYDPQMQQLRQQQIQDEVALQGQDIFSQQGMQGLARLAANPLEARNQNLSRLLSIGQRQQMAQQRLAGGGRTAAPNRYSPVDDDAGESIAALNQIDWTSPKAQEELAQHVRTYGHTYSHPQVAQAANDVRRASLSYRAPKVEKTPDTDTMNFLAEYDPEKNNHRELIRKYPGAINSHVVQEYFKPQAKKQKELSSALQSRFADLYATSTEPPSEDDIKEKAVSLGYKDGMLFGNSKEKNEQLLQQAKAALLAERQTPFNTFVDFLSKRGYDMNGFRDAMDAESVLKQPQQAPQVPMATAQPAIPMSPIKQVRGPDGRVAVIPTTAPQAAENPFARAAETVSKNVEQAAKEKEGKIRQEAFDKEEAVKQETVNWEDRKSELLSKMKQADIYNISPAGLNETILVRNGIDPNSVAFLKPNGDPVKWFKVASALAEDPRIKEIKKSLSDNTAFDWKRMATVVNPKTTGMNLSHKDIEVIQPSAK